MPESPFPIRWSDAARDALDPSPFPAPECLWRSANPDEIPLILPAWARHVSPEIASALDAGYEIRRNVGLEWR